MVFLICIYSCLFEMSAWTLIFNDVNVFIIHSISFIINNLLQFAYYTLTAFVLILHIMKRKDF